MSKHAFCPILALLVAPIAAQVQVHTVDDDPGADFADIQPAIDAAAAGDVVVVYDGDYTNFTMSGKGVSVIGDEGALVRVLGVSGAITTLVENVPDGPRAVIRNVDFVPPESSQSATTGSGCRGCLVHD